MEGRVGLERSTETALVARQLVLQAGGDARVADSGSAGDAMPPTVVRCALMERSAQLERSAAGAFVALRLVL